MRTFLILITVIAFIGCGEEKPEDIICENAIIDLCNPTNNQIVVYGWGTNYVTDTLFPGECDKYEVGYLATTFYENGDVKTRTRKQINYYSPSGSYLVEPTECYWNFTAPAGYINIEHCLNGIFNPEDGELGLDCGGNCAPCKSYNIPCDSMALNRLKWSNSSNPLYLSSSYYGNQINNKLIVRFTFGNGEEFNIAIPDDELPLISEQYSIGTGYYKAEAWFTDRWGNNRRDAVENSSMIFVVDTTGTRTLQFCDADFTNQFGTIFQGSGKLRMN